MIEGEILIIQDQLKNNAEEKEYLLNKHDKEKKIVREEIELLKAKVRESPKNNNAKSNTNR